MNLQEAVISPEAMIFSFWPFKHLRKIFILAIPN
jgi:hypothetical protein